MAVELAAAGGDAAVEGDVEGVERGLPSVGPAGSSLAGGVEAGDGKVQHFQRGLLGGEMAAGVDRAAEPGVQALNRVGAADDPADLYVEGQERHHLRPRVGPQPGDGRVLAF